MHRLLTAANLEPASLMRYCGFLWTWMFEEYARNDWPSGRFVLLADMSNLKLGQSVGEGQVGLKGPPDPVWHARLDHVLLSHDVMFLFWNISYDNSSRNSSVPAVSTRAMDNSASTAHNCKLWLAVGSTKQFDPYATALRWYCCAVTGGRPCAG